MDALPAVLDAEAVGLQRPERTLTVDRVVALRPRQAEVDVRALGAELVALRRSVERGVPYGGERWQKRTIGALGLESTLRPRGRPRKSEK